MTREALPTLFHPFVAGALETPAAGARVLFLGAEPGSRLPEQFTADLIAVQGFRPAFLTLQAEGRAVLPHMPEDVTFDAALVLLGRHRGLNEARLADALERVRSGGLILAGGSNVDGADSFAKRIAKLLPVEGRLPKHHGVAFWLRRPDDAANAIAALRRMSAPALVEGLFETAPGMFSHGRVDPGSAFLAENLPVLSGAVADFGAGWGFLAARAASPALEHLDLYEADHAALEAAKRNLARAAPSAPAAFFWTDLVREPVERRYDFVLMNPPFHTGRAADPKLGEMLIKQAAGALKPGGRLVAVANRQLPYEVVFAKNFAESGEIARNADFKILAGRR